MTKTHIIWEGRPSQIPNIFFFIVLSWTIIFPLCRYLKTRFTIYSFSQERFFMKTGILSQSIDEIELYRVRDYSIYKPFLLRLFGLGNLQIFTSDRTHSDFTMKGIKNPEEVISLLRENVEKARKQSGTREVDIS